MIGLILGYAIIPSAVFLLTYAFVNPSNKSYKWTNLMDIIWGLTIFILTGALIYLYSYIFFNFLYTEHGNGYALPLDNSLLYSVIIGLIVYVFFKLLDWGFYLKKKIIDDDQTIVINEESIETSTPTDATSNIIVEKVPVVTLVGKNINEEIIVTVNKILCVKAIGNYLNVFLITKDNIIKKRTIRNSLSSVWEILNAYDYFYQCHRSYIINVNELVNIKGTSKKMTARIRNVEEAIPIARKNIKEVKEIFNKFI